MIAETRQWRVILAATVPLTLLWLVVVTSGVGGDYDYLTPIALAGVVTLAIVLTRATVGGPTALMFLLFVSLTVLNYRVRGVPEAENDGRLWQNTVKVAVWGCLLVPCLINWRKIIPYLRDASFSIFMVFIGLSIVSMAWSIYPTMTAVSAAGMLVYLLFSCLITAEFSARTLTLAMIWMLAAYCVGNWIWTALDPDTGLLDTEAIGSLLRLQGISGHPNFLGSQAAMLLCLLIGAYSNSYVNRMRFFVLLMIGVVTLIATQSRTAALSLILSFVACYHRRLFFFVIFILLALLTLTIITGNLNEVMSLFVRQGDGDPLAGRGDIWNYLEPKIIDRIWFGYGFNIFEKYYEFDHPNILNPMSPLWGTPIPSHPHNAYLEALFSGGIITLVPFLVWTGLMIWRWLTRPNMLRDLLVLWLIFGSMTEVTLTGPPSLENLLCFIVLAMDQRRLAR